MRVRRRERRLRQLAETRAVHKFQGERGSINRAITKLVAWCVYTRNPEEARRRRIRGLSRRTFVSTVKKEKSVRPCFFTRQDFRYFEIDADNKLSPRESSSRYFIGATHEHFRTKLKNTWLAQLDSRHPREFFNDTARIRSLVSSLLNDFSRVEGVYQRNGEFGIPFDTLPGN